jgi:autotransporter passenger strand-loop-strand repeat protein
MTTIVTPIGPLPFTDGLAVYTVSGTLDSVFSGGTFVGYGIDPFGGGHDSFTASINDQAGIQQALSAAAANSNTLLNYMVVGRQIPNALNALQQNLDYLNTVIGTGTNQLAFILVMPGSDPLPLLTVTASQAAIDTNVLAAISDSYFVSSTNTGPVSAAPGSDFVLAITDNAANINQYLPNIAGANAATRNYGDFTRFNLTITDNATNIGTNLVSIANEFGVDAQFEGLAFQNNNFQGGVQTLSLTLNVTDNQPIPLSVADYEALTNSGPWQGGTILGHYSFTLVDSSANIANLPTLFSVFGNNGNGSESVLPLVSSIAPTGSFVALPVALVLALAGANIPITGPAAANISISDSAANIGETNGSGGLTVAQIDTLEAYGVAKISSNDGPITLSVAQALELDADQIGIVAFQNQSVTLSDSVANIQGLTPSQLSGIVAMGVTQIRSTDDPAVTPFTLNVQQAVALGSAQTHVTVTDANGKLITVSDTAANIGVTNGTPALTLAQIDSLAALGIQGLVSTDAAPLLLSGSELAELLAKNVAFSAPNSTITLDDTAGDIANLTAQQIASLVQDGISQIQSTDTSVTLSAPQAAALLGEIIGVSPALIVSDQAAVIEALTPSQIGGLAAAYGVTLASSDVPLQLSVAQIQALGTGGNTGTAQGPGPNGAMVYDTAAHIGEVNGNGVGGLTAAQINGLPLLFISKIDAFDAALQLTAAQAQAIGASNIQVIDPFGISIDDTATNIMGLSGANIAVLAQDGLDALLSTSGPLDLSVAQVGAAVAANAGIQFSAPSGDGVVLSDAGAAFGNVSGNQLSTAIQDGIDALLSTSGPLDLSVAQVGAAVAANAGIQFSAPSGDGVVLSDAGAAFGNVSDSLLGTAIQDGIDALVSTSGPLDLSVAQVGAAAGANTAIQFSAPSGDVVSIVDTTSNIETLIQQQQLLEELNAEGIKEIQSTDQGIIMNSNEAVDLTDPVIVKVPNGFTVTVADTAANIEALTPQMIGELGSLGFTNMTATDTTLKFDVAQALAAQSANFVIDVPLGDTLEVVDTAANLQTLTPQQVAALQAIGVTRLVDSVGGNVLVLGGGGTLDLSGVVAGLTVSPGITVTVEAGATAIDTTVLGTLAVDAGGLADPTVIDAGGSEVISASGVDQGAQVNGGVQDVFGTANGVTVTAGGTEIVESGATANNTTVDNGVIIVEAGASVPGLTLNAGATLETFQTLNGLSIGNGVTVEIENGATTSGTIVAASAVLNILAGAVDSATMVDGSEDVAGLAVGDTVTGAQTVDAGGVTSSTVVARLAAQIVSGTAITTTVFNGGVQDVTPTGIAASTTLRNGAMQLVENGGIADNTTVRDGAVQFVDGVVSATTVNGGNQAGGGAEQQVESDGTAQSTRLTNGGFQDVLGVASGTTIGTGGFELIEARGVARRTTITGTGEMEVAAGGRASLVAFTSSADGVLLLEDAVRFHGLVAGFGPNDFLDLADIGFNGSVTVGFNEAVSGRNGTLTVTNGNRTASLTLIGQYLAGGFATENDGAGGTLVTYSPPDAELQTSMLNTIVHS